MNDQKIELTSKEIKLLQDLGVYTDEYETLLVAFARICWSNLTEPGDRVANQIIDMLGVKQALEMVITNDQLIGSIHLDNADHYVDQQQLKSGLDRWQIRLNREAIVKAMQQAIDDKCQIITPESEYWPDQVDDLKPYSPIMLWTKGDNNLLKEDSLSIVGARASSAYGQQVTAEFASNAVKFDHTVISGAAYGIDSAAHRATLAEGGNTIAVMAGGLDRLYPAGNAELIDQIATEGLVCSEMTPGSAPTRWRFLQRNRVVASLAKATLVTEAGSKSGSLNTGGHASQLGRALGAVPGPITSVSSLGVHKLLKDYDAMLVANEEDLAELIGVERNSSLFLNKNLANTRQLSIHRRIDDAIPLNTSISTLNIARKAGLSLSETEPVLAELQILGSLEVVKGNDMSDLKWRRIKTASG